MFLRAPLFCCFKWLLFQQSLYKRHVCWSNQAMNANSGSLVSKSLFQVCETKMQKEFKRIMRGEVLNGKRKKVQKMQLLNGAPHHPIILCQCYWLLYQTLNLCLKSNEKVLKRFFAFNVFSCVKFTNVYLYVNNLD